MSNNGNEYPVFDIGLIDEAENQAEKDRQIALEVYPQIQSTITWLERAGGASREAKDRLKEDIAKAKKYLSTHLHHEVPAVRRAVWRALLEFEFTRPLETREEVEKHLAALVKQKFIINDPNGYLSAYGKAYIVHPDSLFEDPEKTETRRNLYALLKRVKEGFLTRSTISLEDLFSGKDGECAVEVPHEKITRNSEEIWLGGGVLLVKSDGTYIRPEEAMGPIEGGIREAKELGVKLLVKSLTSNQPPFINGLDPKKGGKVRLLWRLLKRAQRLAEERQSFSAEATIDPEKFFLQGKPGVCLVDFGNEVWEVKDSQGKVVSRLHSMFFLVSREEKDGDKKLRIVEAPRHLKDFFAPCMGGEYKEKYRLEGVPHPLKAILQTTHRKISSEARKISQIATA